MFIIIIKVRYEKKNLKLSDFFTAISFFHFAHSFRLTYIRKMNSIITFLNNSNWSIIKVHEFLRKTIASMTCTCFISIFLSKVIVMTNNKLTQVTSLINIYAAYENPTLIYILLTNTKIRLRRLVGNIFYHYWKQIWKISQRHAFPYIFLS